jgi:LysM repeat protein
MGTFARRSPLRFMAPVALVAFGIALLMVVSSSSVGGNDTTPSASEQEKARDLGSSDPKPAKPRDTTGKLPTRTYKVKSGDTLASIAEKTGIPVQTLLELNPEVDPQALSTGQRLKLRE